MMFYPLNTREKLLLYILVLVVLVFVLVRFILAPQIKAYVRTSNELKSAKARVKNSLEVISSQRREQEKLEETKKQLNALKIYFSSDMRDGTILTRLGLEAEKEGVNITFFQPKPVNKKEHYLELPVNFGVRGPYQNVLNYLNNIEDKGTGVNLTEIRALAIEPWTYKGDEGGKPGMVTAKIKMVIYADKSPAGNIEAKNIKLEKPGDWSIGRPNGFLKPEMDSSDNRLEKKGNSRDTCDSPFPLSYKTK